MAFALRGYDRKSEEKKRKKSRFSIIKLSPHDNLNAIYQIIITNHIHMKITPKFFPFFDVALH